MCKDKIGLFIPTYNAGNDFNDILNLIDKQASAIHRKYIIDSSSTDKTIEIAKKHSFDVKIISRSEFGHGKTRSQAAKDLSECNYIIYMTQDIYLQENAINNIIKFMKKDPNIAVCYGKQEVDMEKGNIFEYRSREFNYTEQSIVKTIKNIPNLGIKTVFSSDAFAIYDQKKLQEINYFPEDLNFSEDMYAATQFINQGYSVGYCATAKVFHTHNYTVREEFNRYRYIGNFHKKYPEIQEQFGKNTSEGIRLVLNEINYLIKKGYAHLVPESIVRNLAKYLGYRFVK